MDRNTNKRGAVAAGLVAFVAVAFVSVASMAGASAGGPVENRDIVVTDQVSITLGTTSSGPSVNLTSDDPGVMHAEPARPADAVPASSADTQAQIIAPAAAPVAQAPAPAVVLADEPDPTTPAAPTTEPPANTDPFAGGPTENPRITHNPEPAPIENP